MGTVLLAWSWVKAFLPSPMSIVSKIPMWGWITGAAAAGLLWYGHEISAKVRAEMTAAAERKITVEVIRQHSADNAAIEQAQKESQANATRLETLKEGLDEASNEIAKWKQRASVCVPANVTDILRNGSTRRHSAPGH